MVSEILSGNNKVMGSRTKIQSPVGEFLVPEIIS